MIDGDARAHDDLVDEREEIRVEGAETHGNPREILRDLDASALVRAADDGALAGEETHRGDPALREPEDEDAHPAVFRYAFCSAHPLSMFHPRVTGASEC